MQNYTYVTFKSTETPGELFPWVITAYVETQSIRVLVKPPCMVPPKFKCSLDIINCALQFPFPAETIWSYLKKKYKNVIIQLICII